MGIKNTERLPEYILDILRERLPGYLAEKTIDEIIDLLSPAEIFKNWCEWEGFVGKAEKIKKAHDDIFPLPENDSRQFFKTENRGDINGGCCHTNHLDKECKECKEGKEGKEYKDDKDGKEVKDDKEVVCRDTDSTWVSERPERDNGERSYNMYGGRSYPSKKDKREKCDRTKECCSETGDGCFCRKLKGHQGRCQCPLCGEEF